MGAGGVTRQTSRRNTVMPYNVGFLNEADDKQNYNTAVYDELHKVSAASTHMFQALDDIHSEIDQRMKALDALNLQYNALQNVVTTQVNTAIATIQTQMGNLSSQTLIDYDATYNDPANPNHTIKYLQGTIVGIHTEIKSANTNIQHLEGLVTDNGHEIARVETDLSKKITDGDKTVTNSLTNYMKLSDFDAVWGANSHVNGKTAGVQLYNDGKNSYFRVQADKFFVSSPPKNGTTEKNAGNMFPFSVVKTGGAGTTASPNTYTTYIADAAIRNASITNAKIADGSITNAKIANATIEAAKIKTLDASKITAGEFVGGGGKIRMNVNGSFTLGTNASTPNTSNKYNGIVLDANGLKVYSAGVLRISVGKF